jgi:hypothetical protein
LAGWRNNAREFGHLVSRSPSVPSIESIHLTQGVRQKSIGEMTIYVMPFRNEAPLTHQRLQTPLYECNHAHTNSVQLHEDE